MSGPTSLSALEACRKKTLADVVHEHEQEELEGTALEKSLSAVDVIAFGIGSTVGAGLFVITGRAASEYAGPAITLSFLLASIACLLSALCYAELAARIPVAGSAYSYTYVSLGEGAAWFIGWNITLEYAVAASAVARGWAGYLAAFLDSVGYPLPWWLYSIPLTKSPFLESGCPIAALLVLACTGVLLCGVRESSRMNKAMTAVNLAVIMFIIFVGVQHVSTDNWEPFAPRGVDGVVSGAAYAFFSYIGFDAVCTLGEELRDPRRDLPVGIIGSLAAVTVLYIAVSAVLTGMVPVSQIDADAPLAAAFVSAGLPWAARLVAFGSVTILTATTFCSLFGQPRVLLSMARDGLIPRAFGNVTHGTHVPAFGTVVSGVASAVMALLFGISELTDVISIGTLSAFMVVCFSVLVLRFRGAATKAELLGPGVGSAAARRGGWWLRVRAAAARRTAPWMWIAGFFVAAVLLNVAVRTDIGSDDDSGEGVRTWPVWSLLPVLALTFLPPLALSSLYEMNTAQMADDGAQKVPWIPCLGIVVNVHLIAGLTEGAMVRMVVWTAMGAAIYAAYGYKSSALGALRRA
ncbi:unnamed protein product [Pedinophyceae sp. YPF-701]|nr:unnamed protein product [Pedinophyceae sp. YPF-701]